MPSSRTEPAAVARWRNTTPEQRRAATRKARLALAMRELVDQAPTLSEEQRARLRTLLQPPETGDAA